MCDVYGAKWPNHEFQLQTMLWHLNARVNSHQRWKQTRFRVCFHLWCELTSTINATEWQVSWNSCTAFTATWSGGDFFFSTECRIDSGYWTNTLSIDLVCPEISYVMTLTLQCACWINGHISLQQRCLTHYIRDWPMTSTQPELHVCLWPPSTKVLSALNYPSLFLHGRLGKPCIDWDIDIGLDGDGWWQSNPGL